MPIELVVTNTIPSDQQRVELASVLVEPDPVLDVGPVEVFLVGGNDLAFEGLKTLLVKNALNIKGVGARLRELNIPAAYRSRRFLVIVDVTDEFDSVLDDIPLFREHLPQACIVVLLDGFQKTIGLLPDKLSVNAILDRNIACDALVKTLRVALAGYGVLSPTAMAEMDAIPPCEDAVASREDGEIIRPTGLSDREVEVIGCIAEGQSNKVIARRFSISEATVKIHVRGILRKVDVRNRTQAAIWALQRGFGSPVGPHID
jgi:two-component system nitrate/nitrite response regulator NarL